MTRMPRPPVGRMPLTLAALAALVPLAILAAATATAMAQDAPSRRPPPRGGASYSAAPLARDEGEKQALSVLEGMEGRSRGMLSVPRDDGRLLRLLVESTGAKNVVELGTSHGYSAVWMALALQKVGGRLTTFEIDAERAKLARENFKQAGVEKVVTLVEGDAHKEVARVEGPVDVVFLDADKEGYIDYLNQLLPRVRPGGLVVAHNIDPGRADPRYIEAITRNPDLDSVFGNFGAGGVSLTLKKR